jgi:hypothetical protein
MQNDVLTDARQLTPERLTDALRRSGALAGGAVIAIDILAVAERFLSANARLRPRYSPDADGELPPALFLKMVTLDQEDEWLQASEYYYYTRDYASVVDTPLLRCYDAAYDADQGRFHLLLDDVSETHVPAGRKPVTLEYGLSLAESLAALHAPWWDSRRLEAANAPIHDAGHIERFIAIARPGVEHILACCGAELQPHWPALIDDIFARHPQMLLDRNRLAAVGDAAGYTLIHGDAGDSNILVPSAGNGPLYLIDRGPFEWSLTTWLGVYDLAYAMVLDWPVEVRRALEPAVLRRYHSALTARGVSDYPWERLIDDYRLMVPMAVFVAVEWCRGGPNLDYRSIWMAYLQNALTACEDWGWSLGGSTLTARAAGPESPSAT